MFVEAKRASGSPEAGVTGDSELPDAGAGNWTQVLGMSLFELTTESSLWPQHHLKEDIYNLPDFVIHQSTRNRMSGGQNKQVLVHKDKSAHEVYGEGFHALCAADFPHTIGRQCVLLRAILSTA